MVQFSGVIRIELSAAINALHHSSSLRDASWTAVAVYQKEPAHSYESKLSMVLRRAIRRHCGLLMLGWRPISLKRKNSSEKCILVRWLFFYFILARLVA